MTMQSEATLWIVATPIGNQADLSPRAVQVLKDVTVIFCEDTRHSRKLVMLQGIQTPLQAYHDHNEQMASEKIIERLQRGESVALISDAGTPLISDPGYRLVSKARAMAIRICAVPGPCALIAALSISGLATDRFVFEGFLPAKSGQRVAQLQLLRNDRRSLVFYEAKHRITESLTDMAKVFGENRQCVIAREITKLHETVLAGSLAEVLARIEADTQQQLGEFVVMIAGSSDDDESKALHEAERVLEILSKELAPGRAAKITAEITGVARNKLYRTTD